MCVCVHVCVYIWDIYIMCTCACVLSLTQQGFVIVTIGDVEGRVRLTCRKSRVSLRGSCTYRQCDPQVLTSRSECPRPSFCTLWCSAPLHLQENSRGPGDHNRHGRSPGLGQRARHVKSLSFLPTKITCVLHSHV